MKSALTFFLATLTVASLSACGPSVSVHAGADTTDSAAGAGGADVKAESYTYSFDYHDCQTGKQIADSRTGYCQNLTNDPLNHYCAEWMRKDAFDKGCKDSGVEWSIAD